MVVAFVTRKMAVEDPLVIKVYKALLSFDDGEQGFFVQLQKVPRQKHLTKVAGIGASEIRKLYLPDTSEQKINDALSTLLQDQAQIVHKVGFDNKQ